MSEMTGKKAADVMKEKLGDGRKGRVRSWGREGRREWELGEGRKERVRSEEERGPEEDAITRPDAAGLSARYGYSSITSRTCESTPGPPRYTCPGLFYRHERSPAPGDRRDSGRTAENKWTATLWKW